MKEQTDIKELTREQLAEWLQTRGIAPYRAGQILKWLYLRQVDEFAAMTDLSQEIRQDLSEHFTIARLDILRTQTSQDGSVKYLFRLKDDTRIESVLIPEKDHYTLCVSTQVGCAQGCRFCLTGQDGLTRNLTAAEIIAQIRDIKNLSEQGQNSPGLTNVVFMGMGEPLANYQHVINAIRIITDGDAGLKISTRRVTLSTAGLVPQIHRLGQDSDVNLAISLNAADNKTRDHLMPINRKYPLESLIDTCKAYPLKPRQRITFEYILIKDLNASDQDAETLCRLLRPLKAKINLIPFNEHPASGFRRPDETAIRRFQEILLNHHYTAVIRHSKGGDISAACGQLNAAYDAES
jgi:23S rRNA (adenine2503-C2)-methyltransferase